MAGHLVLGHASDVGGQAANEPAIHARGERQVWWGEEGERE